MIRQNTTNEFVYKINKAGIWRVLLVLVCYFNYVPGVSAQTVTIRKILPKDTDSAITTRLEEHYVYFCAEATPRNKLYVLLPGSNSVAGKCTDYCTLAAQKGLHVIDLNYPNPLPGNDLCLTAISDSGYLIKYSKEVIYGEEVVGDISPLGKVNNANSISNRLLKTLMRLHYLYPSEGWNLYYSGDMLLWHLIQVGGHSQGGSHAAVIAKFELLDAVICTSSPRELCRSGVTAWGSFVTPLTRFYAFCHTKDKFSRQKKIWTAMGLDTEAIQDIDAGGTLSGQLFSTSSEDVNHYHKCTAIDPMFAGEGGIWEYLLTR